MDFLFKTDSITHTAVVGARASGTYKTKKRMLCEHLKTSFADASHHNSSLTTKWNWEKQKNCRTLMA
jgi:hypothetical protein